MVYPLLNTIRCKRCKGIWKEEDPCQFVSCTIPADSGKIRKRADPLATRLEKKLDECLARSSGKYCITTTGWKAGDISQELFSRYLKQCVKNRTLEETKDHYGRIWYSRPG
jgi:hypothetical protein